MGNPQVELAVTLTEMVCGECSGVYAITERYRAQKYEKSGFWHCPYCQCSWGYEKGELAREKERHQATLARLNEAAIERDKALRQLQRVKRGVCPQCNRTFANLAAHMKCKHSK